MREKLFILLIWVAETQMIEQGTDGVSRGDLSNGVMTGMSMLEFVPLNQGVDTRRAELVAWIGEAAGDNWITLKPQGWFYDAHT
jgi:hypothetical protein